MRWSDCVNRLCIISHAGREAGNGWCLSGGAIVVRTSAGDYRPVEGIFRDLRGGCVDFAKHVAPEDGDAKQAQDEVGFVNGKADQTVDGK